MRPRHGGYARAMPAAARTLLAIASLAGVNVLAGRLITGPLNDLPVEHRLNADLRRLGGPRTHQVAEAISRSSDTSRAVALGLALTATLAARGGGRAAGVPGLAMAMASATHVIASSLIGRPRPALERLGTVQPTSSFPSGHVGAMTALATVLARMATPLPRPLRVVVRTGLIGYLVTLGWSRLFNGQHYASDVLAGYLNGVVCARLAQDALTDR